MKRFGFLVFLVLGLMALFAPQVAHAGSCRPSYNFQGVRWVGNGYVHVVYNNDSRWAMNNLSRPMGDPYHVDMVLDDCGNVVAQNPIGQGIPATGGIPEPDPMIAQLSDRLAAAEALLGQQAAQIANLQSQVTALQTPVQPAIEEEAATPRLLTFISERPASFAIVGVLALLAIVVSIVAIIYYQRHPRQARPAAAAERVGPPVFNPRPDGSVIEEMDTPVPPWDDARPPAATVYVVDDTPLTT